MMRRFVAGLGLCVLASALWVPGVQAQPSFAVASIRQSGAEVKFEHDGKTDTSPGHLLMKDVTVQTCIKWAYGVQHSQIIAPPWTDSEHFDIDAKADDPVDIPQLKLMLQTLLADRFKLTFHNEKREISAYVITTGKTGVKLAASSGDPNGLPGLGFRALGAMIARNSTIADLAGLLQTVVLDRPVVDQTGLTGKYDFTLNWTPEPTQFGGRGGQAQPPADDTAAPPDLFTALQQQLGLKLESTKTSVPVLAIDKVEKPSEN